MVTTTNNIFRKSEKTDNGEILEPLWSIEKLVLNVLTFEASNPRDTIYALLGIANDGPLGSRFITRHATIEPLELDYNKHTLEVYTDFVQYCIKTTNSLDIICRYWALPVTEDNTAFLTEAVRKQMKKGKPPVPSWIGLLDDAAFGPPSRNTGRLNADTLVGDPGRRIYSACRNIGPEVEFGYIDGTARTPSTVAQPPSTEHGPERRPSSQRLENRFDGTLHAKGVVIVEIEWISARVSEGTIPRECLAAGGWDGGYVLDELSDRLWRTLIADRGPDLSNPPRWYRRACLYCLAKASPNGDINTERLIQDQSQPRSLQDFLKRVQSVVWNRKFFTCGPSTASPSTEDKIQGGESEEIKDRETKSEGDKDEENNTPNTMQPTQRSSRTASLSPSSAPEGTESTNKYQSIFGLASQKAERGDLICILFGCSVPVVLRKRVTNGSTWYQFIGECYAHGIMDGEAIAAMSKDQDKLAACTETFNIR